MTSPARRITAALRAACAEQDRLRWEAEQRQREEQAVRVLGEVTP